jgi:hypothetical protein
MLKKRLSLKQNIKRHICINQHVHTSIAFLHETPQASYLLAMAKRLTKIQYANLEALHEARFLSAPVFLDHRKA